MAIKTYQKGSKVVLSSNFNSNEFDCHGSGCCSQTLIDEQLVKYLQKIRDHFGKSVNVSSGYRCATHNKNVGGATASRHTKGQAADIYISGVAPAEIAKYAESIGILGIGLYETNADGHFVHIDTRTTKSFWYGQSEQTRSTFGGKIQEEVKKEETIVETKEMYRVRKTWADAKSQVGAYTVLQNAKNACDKAGAGYEVYNSKGEAIYPTSTIEQPKEEVKKPDVSKVDTSAADPKKMWDYFKSKDLNDYGVAGLMGNLYAESGLRSCNLQNTYEKSLGMTDAEYTAAVDAGTYTNFVNDKAGYGLAQWTYWSLKEQMFNYFKQKKKSIGDLDTQMEFLAYQLSNNYKAVWETLKTAKSVREASDAVLLKFERPADQSTTVQEKRASYGQKYFDSYGTKVSKPVEKEEEIKVPSEGGNGQMKYSSSNKPLCCMQTQSTCYKGTSIMTVKGVLWHSTGANNPNLKRYVQPSDKASDRDKWLKLLGKNSYGNDWNHTSVQAGLNCWIGKLADGTVTTVQTMPWNYKPWGCASGPKGSCNNGWIQFEICEDGLTDKTYFNKVYKEACEITAYLCKLYGLDPKGTVTVNGVKVPVILCHADSYKLGMGSNHGDVLHWFRKHGKTMDDVRNDVAKLMGKTSQIEPAKPAEPKEMYRVRKTWEDSKSQVGAYTDLKNAKEACDKAGKGYEVYNAKGVAIYPNPPAKEEETKPATPSTSFKVGQEVKLVSGAKYASGVAIPSWLFKSKLYVREIYKNGNIVFSTQKTGAVTGVVAPKYLTKYSATTTSTPAASTFKSYIVAVTTDVLNVRSGPGTGYKINTQVKRHELYTIVDEKNGWGKLKSGAGWISLAYTKKA